MGGRETDHNQQKMLTPKEIYLKCLCTELLLDNHSLFVLSQDKETLSPDTVAPHFTSEVAYF